MLLYHYCFATLYLRAIFKYKPPGGYVRRGDLTEGFLRGAYIRRGDLTEGFFALRAWGAYIWRGLYMEGLIYGILRYLQENKHRKKEIGQSFEERLRGVILLRT